MTATLGTHGAGRRSINAVDWHSDNAEMFSARYEASSRFKERLRVWEAAIDRFLPEGGSVLDAGCGPGKIGLLAAARARRIVAFDGSAPRMRAGFEEAGKVAKVIPDRLHGITEKLKRAKLGGIHA